MATEKIKYPRTCHLPGSGSITSDDKVLANDNCFIGKKMVITTKMDGENTTMYRDYYHARSLDSGNHPSRNFVKGIWGQIRHEIPDGFRICGENLYQKHSIFYDNLESYFMVISIWDNSNMCLSWEETAEYCKLLGLIQVPVIMEMGYDYKKIVKIFEHIDKTTNEGIVIRNSGSFHYSEFSENVAKMVRPNHVTTTHHWMEEKPIANRLKIT